MGFDFATLRESFFDRPGVARKIDAMKRRGLSKQGAYVRTRARSSIRQRKKSSPPGQPPSSHSGELRLIFFAWDQKSESVVVGPVLFGGKGPARGASLLEHGGDATRRGPRGLARKVHYRGNPFMRPAEEAERPKFARGFKDQLR